MPIETSIEDFVEREPVTIICSEKGWIRAAKGHLEAPAVADIKYKEGDRQRFVLHAMSSDRLLVFATNGRFYTLGCDKLPSARGHGEPIRLMVDLGNDQDIVDIIVHRGGRKFVVAAETGRGFMVPEDEVVAQTRNGRQVLNLGNDEEARVLAAVPEDADMLACLGENRKLLIFPLDQVPEMARGRGVILQRYKDGGLADLKAFRLADGLTWSLGESRTGTELNLAEWVGTRAQAGRLPPRGFSRANKF